LSGERAARWSFGISVIREQMIALVKHEQTYWKSWLRLEGLSKEKSNFCQSPMREAAQRCRKLTSSSSSKNQSASFSFLQEKLSESECSQSVQTVFSTEMCYKSVRPSYSHPSFQTLLQILRSLAQEASRGEPAARCIEDGNIDRPFRPVRLDSFPR
jgi:hypothetical protein